MTESSSATVEAQLLVQSVGFPTQLSTGLSNYSVASGAAVFTHDQIVRR
jgi:hypothetical protein